MFLTQVASPLGDMLLGTTDKAVCLLEFLNDASIQAQLERVSRFFDSALVPRGNDLSKKAADQLEAYFQGSLRDFEVPLDLRGTPFQLAAWNGLLTIPYGTTLCYSEQAARIGKPGAVRAIGGANHENRIAILVPCHRVVGKNGHLTGYGGGMWRKRRLLALESPQGSWW